MYLTNDSADAKVGHAGNVQKLGHAVDMHQSFACFIAFPDRQLFKDS